ncbi:MAG: hypothetical protein AAFV85_04870 [Cyanobacteria bacterium J06634_6]
MSQSKDIGQSKAVNPTALQPQPMAYNRSIDQILSSAHLAINNSLNNPDILTVLADFGYTATRINKGKQLYNIAAAAQLTQTSEAGEQLSATATVNEARTTAQKTYMRFVKVARVAFKGKSGIATQLDLAGRRKETLSGWMSQANQFYKNALADKAILSELKSFGMTEAKLKAGLNELKAIEQANLTQEKEKGEAQAATQQRDVALDALQDWMSDFIAIAKIALEDEPQQLEGLGVLVRSAS